MPTIDLTSSDSVTQTQQINPSPFSYRDPLFESSVRSFNDFLLHSRSICHISDHAEPDLLSNAISNGSTLYSRIDQVSHQSVHDPDYESNMAYHSRPFTECRSQLFKQVFNNDVFKHTINQQAKDKYERQKPLYDKYGIQVDDPWFNQSNQHIQSDDSKSNIVMSKEQCQINQLYADLNHTTQSISQLSDVAVEAKKRHRIKPADRKHWTTIFHSINQSKSGFISCAELKKAFRSISMKLSSDDVTSLMKVVDSNFDHRISLPEFVAALANDTKEWDAFHSLREEEISRTNINKPKNQIRPATSASAAKLHRPHTASSTQRSVQPTRQHKQHADRALLPASLWVPALSRHANVDSIIHREAHEKQERARARVVKQQYQPANMHNSLQSRQSSTALSRPTSGHDDDEALESEPIAHINAHETLQHHWKDTQEQVLAMRIGREIAAAQSLTRPSTAPINTNKPSSSRVTLNRTQRDRRFISAINQCVATKSHEVKIIGMKPIDIRSDISTHQSASLFSRLTTSRDDRSMFDVHSDADIAGVLIESDEAMNQVRSVDNHVAWFVDDYVNEE